MKHSIIFPLSSNNSIISPLSPNNAIVQKHIKIQRCLHPPYINKHPIKYTTKHFCIYRDVYDFGNYHLSDGHRTRCPTNNQQHQNQFLENKRNTTLIKPNQ